MAVGKTGVINTGSLYVMTPASGSAEEMTYEGLQKRFDGTMQKVRLLSCWPISSRGIWPLL